MKFLLVLLFFAAAYLLTTRVIPWGIVKTGRLFGFRMKPTPITQKRLARFKRIKRGYYAFRLICTLYVLSFFLELLVNDKALVICYDGRYAFPAVAEWLDHWIPFLDIPSYVKRCDFGLTGDDPVEYRKFAAYCANPELFKEEIRAREKDRLQQKEELESWSEPPPKPEPVPKPPPFERPKPKPPPAGASQDVKDAYARVLRAWEEARDRWEEENADALDAYEEYQDALRDWQEYDLSRKALEGIEREIALLRTSYEKFKSGKAWILLAPYPYGPRDPLLDLPGKPPFGPSWWPYLKSAVTGVPLPEDPAERAKRKILPPWSHPFGTTDNGLDVFPQLAYGFRISITFALLVAAIGYAIGVIVGGLMGYYGGWTDIIIQRFIEIYGSIPFLYTIMILASIVQPSLFLLVVMLVILRSWIGITYYVRGEFYREKAKDYVQSAIGTGVSDWKVMVSHILPNSLVPVVTWAPFAVVSYMLTLVSLDYLGFGLPPGTPSWGYLLNQGQEYVTSYPHLILIPTLALAGTLFCVVVVGEAVREAFDPKVFSRLR